MTNFLSDSMKQSFLKPLARILMSSTILEKALVYLSSKPLIRKHFRVGALAMTYMSSLHQPEYKIADLGLYKIYVNIAEYLGSWLYFFKENPELFSASLVSKIVMTGDICIDVGANMGSYTFLMASKVGKEGKVFAFEPNPELYSMVLKSISINQMNQFVLAEKLATYSKSGETLEFYYSNNPQNSGTSSLVNHGVYVNENNFILINTITLDDYFQGKLIDKCKLIKIDVERAESEVIKGMKSILQQQRISYIVIEQMAGSEAGNLLNSFGYKAWLIDENKKMLVNQNRVVHDNFGNFIFVSPICLDEFKHKYAEIIED